MANNNDFIEDLSEKLQKSIAETTNTLAEMVYSEIIQSNPVKTGYSASNWNISVDEPDLSVHPAVRDPNASYAPDARKAAPPNPDMKEVFVANGVDYMQFLNEGSSQQAPSGWIEAAIERVVDRAQDVMDDKLDAAKLTG